MEDFSSIKQLLDEGYIIQKTGNNDRRQRLLYATPKGEALVGKKLRVSWGLLGPAEQKRMEQWEQRAKTSDD